MTIQEEIDVAIERIAGGCLYMKDGILLVSEVRRLRDELAMKVSPCPKCGQVRIGQTGEYPCSQCGLPTMHDEAVEVAK